mmetsp:Transcript_95144/g.308070  ORF Transcript_95144/g.308070 Transcript_95144/m.308070 type:complete len:209 (-) Transcript_95144:117-743(-)
MAPEREVVVPEIQLESPDSCGVGPVADVVVATNAKQRNVSIYELNGRFEVSLLLLPLLDVSTLPAILLGRPLVDQVATDDGERRLYAIHHVDGLAKQPDLVAPTGAYSAFERILHAELGVSHLHELKRRWRTPVLLPSHTCQAAANGESSGGRLAALEAGLLGGRLQKLLPSIGLRAAHAEGRLLAACWPRDCTTTAALPTSAPPATR